MKSKNILFAVLAFVSAGIFISCQTNAPAEVEPITSDVINTLLGNYAYLNPDTTAELDTTTVLIVSKATSQDSTSTVSDASVLISYVGNDTTLALGKTTVDIVRTTYILGTTLYVTSRPNIVFYPGERPKDDSGTTNDSTATETGGSTIYFAIESDQFYKR